MKTCLIILSLLPCLVSAGWWESFGNTELNRLVERGLAQHPSPQAAVAALESSQAMLASAKAGRAPQVSVHAGIRAGREKTMYTNREVGDTDRFAGSAQLSWEIDLFSRVKGTVTAADAGTQQAIADLEGVRLSLSTAIVGSALQLSLLERQLEVEQERVAIHERLLKRVTARAKAGVDAQALVDQQQADLQMAVHMASLRDIAMKKELARLRSLVPDAEPVILRNLKRPEIPEAEVRRPDVAAAWWRAQAAGALAQSASAERYPKLEFIAKAAGEGSADEIEPWKAWAGPVLSIPLWQPDRKANANVADARARKARAEFERISLIAMREMNEARIDLDQSEHMTDHTATRHASLLSLQQKQSRRSDAGLIQQSEALGAELTALRAELDALEWQTSEWKAHVAWIKASGATKSIQQDQPQPRQ